MKHREKDLGKPQNISELWDNFKWPNIHIIGVAEGEQVDSDLCMKNAQLLNK